MLRIGDNATNNEWNQNQTEKFQQKKGESRITIHQVHTNYPLVIWDIFSSLKMIQNNIGASIYFVVLVSSKHLASKLELVFGTVNWIGHYLIVKTARNKKVHR